MGSYHQLRVSGPIYFEGSSHDIRREIRLDKPLALTTDTIIPNSVGGPAQFQEGAMS